MIEVIRILLSLEDYYASAWAALNGSMLHATVASVAVVNLLFIALWLYFQLVDSLRKAAWAVVRIQFKMLKVAAVPLLAALVLWCIR